MSWWEAVGAAVGTSVGQWHANTTNWRIAKKQMAFQERMSNTAVQRRMEDMRLTGINPLLAGQHEASSPAGAQTTMQNALGQGISSAMQAIQLKKQLKKTDAEIENIEAATRLTGTKSDISGPAATIMRSVNEGVKGLLGQLPTARRKVTDGLTDTAGSVSPSSITGMLLGRDNVQNIQAANEGLLPKRYHGGSMASKNTKVEQVRPGIYQIYRKKDGRWIKVGAPKDKSYFEERK